MRLEELLRTAARSHPHRLAVHDGRRAWTYAEIDLLTADLSRALAQAGVRPGDRVAVLAEKSGPVLAAFQAVLRLGVAYVPFDPGSPDARIASIVADCTPSAIITDLRWLRLRLPDALLMNLYGPTETNVCTTYTVPADLPDHLDGSAVSGDEVWAQLGDGGRAGGGEEGQLVVSGPTVMLGYWGVFEYLGRLDQMVKVRSHRVEFGDIEAAIQAHPAVDRAVVVADGSGLNLRLVAFLRIKPGCDMTLVSTKSWLADRLPAYMSVDDVRVVPDLPRTDNGKVDRLWLREMAATR